MMKPAFESKLNILLSELLNLDRAFLDIFGIQAEEKDLLALYREIGASLGQLMGD